MNGISRISSQRPVKTLAHAFTLVEVMVSMLIFAMSATGLTGLFIQNLRYSTWQTQNVHITNSTFAIADQIKNMGADAIWQAYQAADTATPLTLNVTTVDPSDLVDGYKTVTLHINQKDYAKTTGTNTPEVTSKVPNSDWNTVNFKLGRDTTAKAPSILVDYWITIRRNVTAKGTYPAFDILELTLIDRWAVGGKPMKTLNQIQLTFPATNCSFNNFN
jgi:prepilin-type N-terminal cleavage/methylation domain-containing protein